MDENQNKIFTASKPENDIYCRG